MSGLSLRAIAKEVGISAPAIYKHFKNKESIFVEIILEGHRRFYDYLIAEEAEGGLARVLACGRGYARFGQEHSALYLAMFAASPDLLGLFELADETARESADTFGVLLARVEEGLVEKHFLRRDPRDLALSIWAHVHGLVMLRLLAPGGVDESDGFFGKSFMTFFEESTRAHLRGLSTPAGRAILGKKEK